MGGVAGDHQVAKQRQPEPGPRRRAVDRDQQRFGHRRQRHHRAVDCVGEVFDERAAPIGSGEAGDIAAGAEEPSGPDQHDATHRQVIRRRCRRHAERLGGGEVKRIAMCRPVELDAGDAIAHMKFDAITHPAPLSSRA